MPEKTETYIQRFQAAMESMKRKLGSEIMGRVKDLTLPQCFILHFIREQETCKITKLAEKMNVKPSAVTVMIDRLEKAGFVARHHDAADRRAVLVRLTEKGHEALTKVEQIRNEVMGKYLSRLERDELERFLDTFEKLIKTDD